MSEPLQLSYEYVYPVFILVVCSAVAHLAFIPQYMKHIARQESDMIPQRKKQPVNQRVVLSVVIFFVLVIGMATGRLTLALIRHSFNQHEPLFGGEGLIQAMKSELTDNIIYILPCFLVVFVTLTSVSFSNQRKLSWVAYLSKAEQKIIAKEGGRTVAKDAAKLRATTRTYILSMITLILVTVFALKALVRTYGFLDVLSNKSFMDVYRYLGSFDLVVFVLRVMFLWFVALVFSRSQALYMKREWSKFASIFIVLILTCISSLLGISEDNPNTIYVLMALLLMVMVYISIEIFHDMIAKSIKRSLRN